METNTIFTLYYHPRNKETSIEKIFAENELWAAKSRGERLAALLYLRYPFQKECKWHIRYLYRFFMNSTFYAGRLGLYLFIINLEKSTAG